MKLEIDFGRHVKKAREIVSSLLEGAEDTKISPTPLIFNTCRKKETHPHGD